MAIPDDHRPDLTSRRLALFPTTTKIIDDRLTMGGLDLSSLAREHGTPLYLYDRATMDASVAAYGTALQEFYPGKAQITYAGKAFLCTGISRWIREQGLWVDCTGEGEISLAVAGKLEREAIIVHGVNKSGSDLRSALSHAGTVVVDNLTELESIARLAAPRSPDIWLRFLPGVAVATHHAHTQTGQHGSKFGMTTEEVVQAAQACRRHKLPLNGLHFHQGSNFRDPVPLLVAIDKALDLVNELGLGDTWHFCPGGGWGVAYHEDELPQPDMREYVRLIALAVVAKCRAARIPLPTLHLEPGRSMVARAGVAIYQVGTVKRRSDVTWLLVDGGMADNPRHALYGSKYSCLPVSGLNREFGERVSIAGPYCESGDVLIEGLPMPRIQEGELIAIPASGAYQLSMSSNYNGARRPAVVWLQDGRADLIIQRESLEDLARRDVPAASHMDAHPTTG